MRNEPKIEFTFNLDTEKEIFLDFWRNGMSLHHDLNDLLQNKDEETVKIEISRFVDKYYQKNENRLKKNFAEVIKDWHQAEASYYDKVAWLLNNHPWPEGIYTANASILCRFPRFIEKRWFAFPVNGQAHANMVIAHEMLHFITYDYMEKKFGLKPSECYDQDNTFWQFAENLNALIEDEPIWYRYMNGQKAFVKPECAVLYQKMKKIWYKKKDVDTLIKKIFNLEQSNNFLFILS